MRLAARQDFYLAGAGDFFAHGGRATFQALAGSAALGTDRCDAPGLAANG